MQPEHLVQKLLLHVARCQQAQAEELLRIQPDLLLAKWQETDYSGRKFSNAKEFSEAEIELIIGVALLSGPNNSNT